MPTRRVVISIRGQNEETFQKCTLSLNMQHICSNYDRLSVAQWSGNGKLVAPRLLVNGKDGRARIYLRERIRNRGHCDRQISR